MKYVLKKYDFVRHYFKEKIKEFRLFGNLKITMWSRKKNKIKKTE